MTKGTTVIFDVSPSMALVLGIEYKPEGYALQVPAQCPIPLKRAFVAAVKFPFGIDAAPMTVLAKRVEGSFEKYFSSVTLALHNNFSDFIVAWVPNDTKRNNKYLEVVRLSEITWDSILKAYNYLLDKFHEHNVVTLETM